MHIVIVNRWPRFTEGPRWDNELVRYEDFIDHRRHQVSYVVDRLGADGVWAARDEIAGQVQIADVNRFDLLRAAVAQLVDQVGPVDQLIALSEFTLEIAAGVREELGIPGPTRADVAVYRDKVRMKQILAPAGLRVPRFTACETPDQCRAFAAECGYPVILKPVDGAASIGVHRVDDETSLDRLLLDLPLERYEIEEFVVGDIYHVDGFVGMAGEVEFQVVSRYLNDCLAFEQGAPLGSAVVRPSPIRDQIADFSARCLKVLTITGMPFHLELFRTPADELVFLEVGGRVGGSEVPHLLNKLLGVNLFEVWLRALAGEHRPPVVTFAAGESSGGWLCIPKPKELPARVVKVTTLKARIGTIWRELVPEVGQVLEPGGGYDAIHSGRFILLAASQDEVEADLHRIVAEFELETTKP
jgi:hypothetical protein